MNKFIKNNLWTPSTCKRKDFLLNKLNFLTDDSKSSGLYKIKNQFGFERVNSEDKQEKVDDVFKSVANKYDVMNDAMSLGVHRIWKDIFIDRLSPSPGTKLLDVAGGTGDISFRFLNYLRNTTPKSFVTVCDINPKMLDVGKKKSADLKYCTDQIEWVEGNAEKLPFEERTFDAYTIAFGIRNVTHIDKALDEAYRVLKPGGRFMCLEFSHISNEYLKWVYDQYSFQVIPVLGELIAGEWRAYQYLVESIRNFPNQEKFKDIIQNAGFRLVTYENLTFGVVAIHSGFKLQECFTEAKEDTCYMWKVILCYKWFRNFLNHGGTPSSGRPSEVDLIKQLGGLEKLNQPIRLTSSWNGLQV